MPYLGLSRTIVHLQLCKNGTHLLTKLMLASSLFISYSILSTAVIVPDDVLSL